MRNKKGMEMTISTVVILVMVLLLLAVGIYITYNYILKPSQGAGSLISCDSRGGRAVANCIDCPDGICLDLPTGSETAKKCCIPQSK